MPQFFSGSCPSFVTVIFGLLVTANAVSQELETITVTASATETALKHITGNISQVDQTALERVSAVHISQALFRVPGAWISRGNGQEHLTAIRSPVLTGAGACGAFFLAQDRISLRGPAFCNVNQLFDSHFEIARRIEVVRGPGSTLYGTNAVHGVINIMTPNPLSEQQGSLSLETGPDDFLRGNLAFSKQHYNSGFGLYSTVTQDKGFQRHSGYDQQKLTLIHQQIHHNLEIKTVASATNLNQETAGFITGFESYRDPQLRQSNPNPEAYRDSKSARIYSVVDISTGTSGQLTLTPYLRWSDMAFLQHYLPWQATEKNAQRAAGLRSSYQQLLPQGSVITGIDMDISEGSLLEQQDQPFSEAIPMGVHYDYRARVRVISPYLQWQHELTPRFRTEAGARYEYAVFDYTNNVADGDACAPAVTNCRFTRPQDQRRNYANWSFKLGMTYALSRHHIVYAQLSDGYRVPQATELFRLQGGQKIADLQPENMLSSELGMRGSADSLQYDLTAFYMKKRDIIVADSNRRNINAGQTRHRGVEVRAKQHLSESVYLQLSATIAEHEYASSIVVSAQDINGHEIDTAPSHMGSAQLGWRIGEHNTLELEWLHMGDYYLNAENTARYEGHELLNLRGEFRLSEALSLDLRLINLLDQDYAERADFGFGSYRYFVGRPRSFYAELQWQW